MTDANIGASGASSISKLLVLAYAAFAYTAFLLVFTYFILFTIPLFVPHTVDNSMTAAWLGVQADSAMFAVLINIGLIALFGLQHSVMARPGFKEWLTRWLPKAAERATFVLLSSIALALVIVGWQPMPATLWDVEGPAAIVLYGLNFAAWGFAFAATYMIDHFDLFGLKQAWLHARDRAAEPARFMTKAAYSFMRHPLQSGIFFGLWIVPQMSAGHLLLSLGFSIYIVIGTKFEERDLVRVFGQRYIRYREQVPMLLPRILGGKYREEGEEGVQGSDANRSASR